MNYIEKLFHKKRERHYIFLFLLISCKMKNLYQRDIRMKKNKIENLNKIRFDGYYFEYPESPIID